MVGPRTLTALVGFFASLLSSVLLWWRFETTDEAYDVRLLSARRGDVWSERSTQVR